MTRWVRSWEQDGYATVTAGRMLIVLAGPVTGRPRLPGSGRCWLQVISRCSSRSGGILQDVYSITLYLWQESWATRHRTRGKVDWFSIKSPLTRRRGRFCWPWRDQRVVTKQGCSFGLMPPWQNGGGGRRVKGASVSHGDQKRNAQNGEQRRELGRGSARATGTARWFVSYVDHWLHALILPSITLGKMLKFK